MKVVTKDHREIKCKLIDFRGEDVELTLWDDTVEWEELSNISYICLS